MMTRLSLPRPLLATAAFATLIASAAPALAGDDALISEGAALFSLSCRDCHGRAGEKAALGLSRPVAALSAAEITAALDERRRRPPRSMQDRIKSGLTDDDVEALAAYIASIKTHP
ncbi:c-type cytochrome [Rhodospirillum rubrum]|uniref:c-type cytochrome n=1 Tax=Rhodospirillum rubrum TaxID=1085 RepID=UPI00003C29DB|nr:c-type cytochrome [Rhodospirillum rubrum]AEO49337.1 cytochrome c, class I [Rhodospirillum rubrum F11]QXG79561.1 c-type cytochrome [Rhodospirillum rubrum]